MRERYATSEIAIGRAKREFRYEARTAPSALGYAALSRICPPEKEIVGPSILRRVQRPRHACRKK
jgi:hypothetical protein